MKKTILFIHQSFPGQFMHLAEKLAQEGHRVAALALTPKGQAKGVSLVRYGLRRAPQKNLPDLLAETDVKILRGESAAVAMHRLQQQGFSPDVVYVHPGWGEALFVKTVWPHVRLVTYAEWFYNDRGQEVDFDPEIPALAETARMRLRLKNTVFLHALNDADAVVAPTRWQRSRFPAWAQERIRVVHDGLDIAAIRLGNPKTMRVPDQNLALRYGDPVITFAARYLEPVRGFHVFMRSLPQILKQRPDAHVFVMGKDAGTPGVGYGGPNPLGKSWRAGLVDELGKDLDSKRVHFLGELEYASYLNVMRLSACHVYLTTPFILSWSFLEAAALGLPIVASRTAPVKEFEGLEGLELVDFFDHAALAQKVLEVLEQPVLRTPNDLPDLDLRATLPRLTEVALGAPPATAGKADGKKAVAAAAKPAALKTVKKPAVKKAASKSSTADGGEAQPAPKKRTGKAEAVRSTKKKES